MGRDITAEIEKTSAILRAGGVILYPTDTVWGLGCNALNAVSIERIHAIKQRDAEKSLILLLDDFEKIQLYVEVVPENTKQLIENFGRPVTVIYNKAKALPANLVAGDGTIAIRIVKDEFCTPLIKQLGYPLVSTSANISGEPAPAVYNDIAESVRNLVDYEVEVFRDRLVQFRPSTIIRLFDDGSYTVIRE